MKNPRERNNLRGTSGHSTGTLPSLIAVATFVLIIASLYWAQAILIPVALSILLTFLLSPVAGALERIALGRLPSVILIVVLTFSLLGGIGWIVTLQFGSLANELPTYRKNIRQKIAEIMSDAMLTAEVVARIGEKSPAMICIAAVPPGGLAQTRYLCKRLRARFPDLKIAVGRWGTGSEDSNTILLAGADRVGTTMIETREQMIQLSQISPHSEAQSGTTANPFSPLDALLPSIKWTASP